MVVVVVVNVRVRRVGERRRYRLTIKRQVAYAVMSMELKELYQRVSIRVLCRFGMVYPICRARAMTYSSEDETDTQSRTIRRLRWR